MGKHLRKLIKYLSEGDYQTVDAENQLNPHEKKHTELQKQSGEHVTSSGAAAWLNVPDKNASGDFGLKKPGLIPYTSLVRRPGKTPYFATRWRKVDPKAEKEEIVIIPIETFQGDLKQVYEAWKEYVGQHDEDDSQDLLLPLLGLDDFISGGRGGILAQINNRIIGLASIEVDDLGEARISILSAAPKEIEDGNDLYVEDALREGLDTYVEENEWKLITSSDANVQQADLKKAYRSIRLLKQAANLGQSKDDLHRQAQAAWAKTEGKIPETGDPLYPGRWLKPEEFAAIFGDEAAAAAVEDDTKGGKQGEGTQGGRARGAYDKTKKLSLVSPEDAVKQGMTPGLLANGKKIPNAARGRTVELSTDPKALKLGRYRNNKDKWVSMYSKEHITNQATKKYSRNRMMAMDEPVISKWLKEEADNGRPEAEVMRFMAWTSLRAGSQESLSTTGVEVQSFGASSLLQKHVQINGSQVTLEFTSKAGVAAKFEYDNQELATMLYDRMKKGGFRPTQQLYQVTDDQVARYMKLTMNKTLGLEEKNYSPKDFRTLGARSMTLQAIGEMDAPKNRQEFNKARKAVAVAVSKGLGNDVDTALASYIDPMLFEEWENELEDSDDE